MLTAAQVLSDHRFRECRDVIGVELNRDAIRDARMNARENKIRNVRFVPGDAGWFMEEWQQRERRWRLFSWIRHVPEVTVNSFTPF